MSKLMHRAAPALALGALSRAAAPAAAHEGDMWSFQAARDSLNNSGASGHAMVDLHGKEATVTTNVSGAAETFMHGPFPHVQHFHIGGQGGCLTPAADTDGDGVIDTPEGQPAYGAVDTSLTTTAESAVAVKRFPSGGSYTYERTSEVSDASAEAIKNGTAVVVIHGPDPAKAPAAATEKMSPLAPHLPLAATAPTACGTLTASQMGAMPGGGADAGVETTAGSAVLPPPEEPTDGVPAAAAPDADRLPVVAASPPVVLDLPTVRACSELLHRGLRDSWSDVPPGEPGAPASWYTGSPTPGERGPAVIIGHVNATDGGPDVFAGFRALKSGTPSRSSGRTAPPPSSPSTAAKSTRRTPSRFSRSTATPRVPSCG